MNIVLSVINYLYRHKTNFSSNMRYCKIHNTKQSLKSKDGVSVLFKFSTLKITDKTLRDKTILLQQKCPNNFTGLLLLI